MVDVCSRWPDTFDVPNRHTVDPPLPVVVDLAQILPANTSRTDRRGLPMRVVQAGLALAGNQDAELLGWARVTDGRWLALVRMELPVAGRRGVLPMLQWVPAATVTPQAQRDRQNSASGASSPRPHPGTAPTRRSVPRRP